MCDKQSSSDNDNQSSDSQTLADVVKKSVASVIGTNNDFQTVGKKKRNKKTVIGCNKDACFDFS